MKKILSMLTLSTVSVFAMGEAGPPRDPLVRLSYRNAFDQEAIYRRHQPVLAGLGLLDNALPGQTALAERSVGACVATPGLELAPMHATYAPLLAGDDLSVVIDARQNILETERFKEFQAACLAQLKSNRRSTLLEPAREALTLMTLMGGMTYAIMEAAGANSMGGSFGIFAALFNCVWFVRDVIRSGYNLYQTPPHPVDVYEIQFALNRCFIPRDIWPVISEKFMTARCNQFEERESLDFLAFTLGITTLAPKPFFDLGDLSGLKRDIRAELRQFFSDYKLFSDDKAFAKICANFFKFITALDNYQHGRSFDLPRPIFLSGPGGIGKTHLARLIQNILNRKFGNVVQFDDVVIGKPTDLEGDDTQPALFLRVLRNMCVGRALGSVVVMDEANWLDDDAYKPVAKRVFNGSLSTLKTKYFGGGVDGTGIEFKAPPIFSLVAANLADIADAPLKSRFDFITFPLPKKQALIKYAYTLINEKLRGFSATPNLIDDERIEGEFDAHHSQLHTTILALNNFRAVEEAVPPLLEMWDAEE